MKRSVWPGILGTVVALAMSGAAAAQPACGCTADDHAVKTLARYKHAFAGRVASVEAQDGAVSRVTFDVLRVWKGQRGKTLAVTMPAASAGCGVVFESGKAYLVYAQGEKDALATESCAPNADLTAASASVRQLDLNSGYGSNPLRVQARKQDGTRTARQ